MGSLFGTLRGPANLARRLARHLARATAVSGNVYQGHLVFILIMSDILWQGFSFFQVQLALSESADMGLECLLSNPARALTFCVLGLLS